VNEVSVSQQLARRDRRFLHAGNNPERANTAQAPAPLGKNLRLDPCCLSRWSINAFSLTNPNLDIGADSVTITPNEIMTALSKPDDFILAIVTVDGDAADPRYVRQPFQREPDFAVTSVNYRLADLLQRAGPPA
jgi:hypothetical protein